jgi:hypothetical protein
MVSVYTEVEVDLSDFDTEDLIEELSNRGEQPTGWTVPELVQAIWFKRRQQHDYQAELDQLIYHVIGKIL